MNHYFFFKFHKGYAALPPTEVHVFSISITYEEKGSACLFLARTRVTCITVVNQGGRAQRAGECDGGGGIYDKQINVGVWLEARPQRRQEKKGSIFGSKTTTTRQTDGSTEATDREGRPTTVRAADVPEGDSTGWNPQPWHHPPEL